MQKKNKKKTVEFSSQLFKIIASLLQCLTLAHIHLFHSCIYSFHPVKLSTLQASHFGGPSSSKQDFRSFFVIKKKKTSNVSHFAQTSIVPLVAFNVSLVFITIIVQNIEKKKNKKKNRKIGKQINCRSLLLQFVGYYNLQFGWIPFFK